MVTYKMLMYMKNMKIFALLAAVATLFVACEPSSGVEDKKSAIVGEWHIESWNNQTPEFDVYIEFLEQGTFNIYQQIFTLNYVLYSGTYTAVDGTLTGVYDDGSAWGAGYSYTISADGSQLTLVSDDSTPLTSVYVKESIPAEVKAEATATRASEVAPLF